MVARRTAAGPYDIFKAGTLVDNGTTASTAPNARTIFVGGRNNNGAYENGFAGQIALAGLSAGLSGAEITAYKTCVDTLKTAIGF